MSEPKPLLAPLKPRTVAPQLWKGGRFIPDPWRLLAPGEPGPTGGSAIVPLPRWRAERTLLISRSPMLGVRVEAGEEIDLGGDGLDRLAVIVLVLPKFSDGRAYSTARRLREIAGLTGEIRATGDVLLDQIPLLLRCGFDAFEIVSVPTIAALEAGELPALTGVYQGQSRGRGSPPLAVQRSTT